MPTHIFLQQAVHSRLLDANVNFAAGYELPRNWWTLVEPPLDEDLCNILGDAEAMYKLDASGDAALSHAMSTYLLALCYAPISHFAVQAFDYYNRIPTRFYDSYNKFDGERFHIDMSDPSIAEYRDHFMEQARGYQVGEKFFLDTYASINIRNITMAQNINSDPSKTIVMSTGLAHISHISSKVNGLLLSEALRLINRDVHIISVMPTFGSTFYAPLHGDRVVIAGLDNRSYNLAKEPLEIAKSIVRAEASYTHQLKKACGDEVSIFWEACKSSKEIFGGFAARHKEELIAACKAHVSASPEPISP